MVSAASELGGASARASRSARESYAAVKPPAAPEADRSQPRVLDSDEAYLTLDDITEPVMLEPSFIVDELRPVPPRGRQTPSRPSAASAPARSYGDLIRIAIAVVIVGGIGSLLIWQWPNMVAIYGMLCAPRGRGRAGDTSPPAKPKIPDRIEPGGKPSQPHDRAGGAAVAQRVVLYEEDPNDPTGQAFGRLGDLADRGDIARARQAARARDPRRHRNAGAQDQHDAGRCAATPTRAAPPATPSRSCSSCRRTFPPAASSTCPAS